MKNLEKAVEERNKVVEGLLLSLQQTEKELLELVPSDIYWGGGNTHLGIGHPTTQYPYSRYSARRLFYWAERNGCMILPPTIDKAGQYFTEHHGMDKFKYVSVPGMVYMKKVLPKFIEGLIAALAKGDL